MAHNARVNIDISARETYSNSGKRAVIDKQFQAFYDLANGTSNGAIDTSYHEIITGIGASTTTVRDLVGSLTDEAGNTLTFAEVVLIACRNLSSTAANVLEIGPDATSGFGVLSSNKGFWKDASDRNVLPADGGKSWLILYSDAGVPAAAGSTDELAIITQSGTSANTWELLILGRSA
jgi:hypothetical protein